MLNALGLGFIFQAKDELSHVIEHAHDGLTELKKAGGEAGNSIASAFGMSTKAIVLAGAAIAAVGVGVAFEFAEHAEKFSHAIREAGVASHATAEQMHELEELAINKGLDSLRVSSVSAAETLAELAKEGMDAHAAGTALNGTLSLMRISMGALGSRDAAAIVNDTLGQFGMRADQAGELTDKLAFAMKNFGFRAEELRGTMVGLASGAQLTGASLDDTLLAVGLVKSVFPSATKAAMSMNAAMQQLASTHGQKELKGIGVTVADSTGKIKPLIDILDQIAHRTAKMTDAQVAHKLATIAGGRAAGGLSAIMDALKKGVKDTEGNILTGSAAIMFLRDQIAGAGGTAKKMGDVLNDDLGGAIKALKGGLSNLAILIGAPFEGAFKGVIENLNLFVRGITQLFSQGGFSGEVKDALDKHLGIKDFAIGVFMWIERIKNFFGNLASSFTQTFAPFRPMLTMIGTAFREIGQALGIVDQTAGDNASTWDSFGAVGAGVGSILANIAGSVLPVIVDVMHLLVSAIQFARDVWASAGPVFSGVGQILVGVFEVVAGLLTGNWDRVWDGLIDIVAGALKVILKITMGALGLLADAFDSLGASFGINSGLRGQLDAFHQFAQTGLEVGVIAAKAAIGSGGGVASTVHAQSTAAAGQLAAAAAAGPLAMGAQIIHLTTSVNLDGEKVGEAQAAAKRDRNARSFQQVPAHG